MHYYNTISSINKQRGVALIVLFITIIATGAVFFISTQISNNGQLIAENKTTAALAKAKNAIISHAVSYYFSTSPGHHGFLPCPETRNSTSEGSAVLNCAIGGARYANQLGRLPWKTLQTSPLKDASGECLWYAMSGSFSPSPRALMLNDDTPGMFQVFNENASLFKGTTAEDRIIAIIMAPGLPLNNQSRPNITTNVACKVPRNLVNASNYLDTFQNINNAAVDNINPDRVDQFIASNSRIDNPSINDRVITITHNEIFDAIKSRQAMYADKIKVLGETIGQCLISYAQAAAAIPSSCTNITNCYANCTNARSLCLASAGTGLEIAACQTAHAACRRNCRDNCLAGSGAPPVIYRLPWPAAINLNADYRINTSYSDQAPSSTLLGRLPFTTINSSAIIPNTNDADIFETCALSASSPEMFNLWQNWKDHWFYVVGSDFAPNASSTPPSPCVNCPQFNNGTRYAALLIFSGERINNQLRRANETENPDPLIANSKASLANYLEGSNVANALDPQGNGNYDTPNSNDRIFCIPQDLTPPATASECTP
ncbi:hypothetical protein MNBD_GAMMA07-512 [hydrothermal vent metagenome]|uniref:Uncharacterized protein n=1 Tax=hydrothermal vent metagenome TaxID=652676 RepID=A0A3B0WMA8_9ZZZZ